MRKYTNEMIKWVRKNAPKYTYRQLTDAFNERYNLNISWEAMKSLLSRYKITNGRDGHFKPGHIPSNKGKKQTEFMSLEAIERTKATRFKKGILPLNHKPVGSLRKDPDGYTLIKVKEPNEWELLSRVVWQKANGKIPPGMVVVHINGIRDDDRLENLKLLTRSALARYCKDHLYIEGQKEINESALLVAEIKDKIGKAVRKK